MPSPSSRRLHLPKLSTNLLAKMANYTRKLKENNPNLNRPLERSQASREKRDNLMKRAQNIIKGMKKPKNTRASANASPSTNAKVAECTVILENFVGKTPKEASNSNGGGKRNGGSKRNYTRRSR